MRRHDVAVDGVLLFGALAAAEPARAETKTIARCGAGFLEEVDGYRVLHVKGKPYEMGYQQGALLRDDIRESVRFLFEVKAKELKVELAGVKLLDPKRVIRGIAAQQRKYRARAVLRRDARNRRRSRAWTFRTSSSPTSFPSCFTARVSRLSGSATKDGTLYHGRILDYGCDWRLQEHAVLTVAEPRGKIPFVNVTYAGFVGSVTGMNAERISIGEMGGRGMGHWDGVPMAFLVRMVLEEADYARPGDRGLSRPSAHLRVLLRDRRRRDRQGGGHGGFVERVRRDRHGREPSPAAARDQGRRRALGRRPLRGAGASGSKTGMGSFDAESARHLMDRPVAMKSNLHSVLFETTTTRFWVANASKDGKPAAEQPYHAFELRELLKHQADSIGAGAAGAPARLRRERPDLIARARTGLYLER